MINVSKLKKGVVIDHIEANKGYKIFNQLKLDESEDVVVLMRNVPSQKMGKKDLIKIENDLDVDLTVLGLIDPNVTVNVVENGERVEKIKLSLPEKVLGIMVCKNPRCISKHENVGEIGFTLVDAEKKLYRCEYCDARTSL